MKANLAQLELNRKRLQGDLMAVRRSSLQAGNRGDFRAIARLTLEAAKINRALSDVEVAELSAL